MHSIVFVALKQTPLSFCDKSCSLQHVDNEWFVFRRLAMRMITLCQSVLRLSHTVHFTNLVPSIDVYCSEKELISVRHWNGSSGGGVV